MRSLIDINQIVTPGDSNKKYQKFSKQFLNNDEKTLNIIPPGLLPSENELDDFETFELSCIDSNDKSQQKFINVAAITKSRKSLIVSCKILIFLKTLFKSLLNGRILVNCILKIPVLLFNSNFYNIKKSLLKILLHIFKISPGFVRISD